MTGYLQRLFDRGTGIVAAPPSAPTGDVAPAMAPASPAVGFDQRLADPNLAQVFGLLGVSPDPDALLETKPPEAAAAPLMVPRPSGVAADPITARPPMPSMADIVAPPTVPPRRSIEAVPDAEPKARHSAHVSPSPARANGVEPLAFQPHTGAPAVGSHPPQSSLPAVASRETAPAPRAKSADPSSAIATGRPQVEPPPLAFPHPRQDDHESVRQFETVARVTPLAPTPPPERSPRVFSDARGRAVRRQPAPLEPPPAVAADARELERIAREAVRAELAHRHAVGPSTSHPRGVAPATERDGPRKPASRPASAREASVIGELEPSSSPLTIYGLRRR